MANNKGTALLTNATLRPDDYITSPSGTYAAVMQGDGNLVVYRGMRFIEKNAVWASNTGGRPLGLYIAVMQADGNLVIYQGENFISEHAIWATHTHGSPGTDFTAQVADDGTLYIENKQGTILWTSVPNPLLIGWKMLERDRGRQKNT